MRHRVLFQLFIIYVIVRKRRRNSLKKAVGKVETGIVEDGKSAVNTDFYKSMPWSQCDDVCIPPWTVYQYHIYAWSIHHFTLLSTCICPIIQLKNKTAQCNFLIILNSMETESSIYLFMCNWFTRYISFTHSVLVVVKITLSKLITIKCT